VLFADLDHFKRINDVYGHDVGDQVLIGVARRLSSLVRPVDTLARVSGDAFVFLLEDLSSMGDAEHLAVRIGQALRDPFVVGGAELCVSMSVGVAYSGPGEGVTSAIVSAADAAMYQVKRRGGAAHLVADRTSGRTSGRVDLEQELRRAVAEDTLGVAYQPIVRIADGLVFGTEALLRWTHPAEGPVPAMTAITLAEQSVPDRGGRPGRVATGLPRPRPLATRAPARPAGTPPPDVGERLGEPVAGDRLPRRSAARPARDRDAPELVAP